MCNKPRIFIINGISSTDFKNVEKYIYKLNKKNKIDRYIFTKDKVQAALSELLIRVVYCENNNICNNNIVFKSNGFGKPYIETCNNFHFNISHSDDIIVGIIDNEEVGIDIEFIGNLSEDIAKIFCTNNEYSLILKEGKKNRSRAITVIWSLKEAYLKFLGVGINKDLKSFDVVNKENIKSGVFLYSKQYKNYVLSVCSKKEVKLDSIIEEIDIQELLNRYENILI